MRRVTGIILLAAAVAGCSGGGGFGSDSANAFTAQDACRNSVKSQLTSPATAHFHGESRDFTGSDSAPEFTVTGEVDSENGFGATLTTSWTCTATTDDGGKNWSGIATLFGS